VAAVEPQVAERDGLEPEQEPGQEEPEEPEEPPAEVDAAERLLAHDRCNPQSGPCCSGATSAVRSVEEVEQNRVQNRLRIQNRHRHTVGAASKHSTCLSLHLLVPSWMQRGR
jgi:hypothetical protein